MRLGRSRCRGSLGHDSTRRARPPSAIIRAMCPNVCTSSPLRRRSTRARCWPGGPGSRGRRRRCRWRRSRFPAPCAARACSTALSACVGKAVGEDHDVAFPVGGDELAAGHLQRVGEVRRALGLEPADRGVQPPCVAGRRALESDQAGKRDQADLHGREVAAIEELSGRRLGLDQGLADHARRDVDEQEDANPLGFPNDGDLGRPAQPREVIGHGLDRHGQAVPRVALDGLHLDHAVDVVRDAHVDHHLGVRGVNSREDVLPQDRAVQR